MLDVIRSIIVEQLIRISNINFVTFVRKLAGTSAECVMSTPRANTLLAVQSRGGKY